MRPARLLPSLAAALALAALGLAGSAGAASLRRVGSFAEPTFVTAPPGDASRLFVVERAGRIRVIKHGRALPTPFLDISAHVTTAGLTGMFSMAFAPDYAQSGRFYVFYTRNTGESLAFCSMVKHTCPPSWIEEYRRSDPDHASPGTARRVLQIPNPDTVTHHGGQLQFGPDNLLWISVGAPVPQAAQDLGSLYGKLLRISPTGSGPDRYGIPRDNPFFGQPGRRAEIWSYGLRNPWRFSFDRQTGDLIVGDVGENKVEEVDFAPAPGRGRAANFGWPRCEGEVAYPLGGPCTFPQSRPVIQRFHTKSTGVCSIDGGYVVRDAQVPGLFGRYLYGDLCNQEVRSALLRRGFAGGDGDTGLRATQLVSFGEDACGRVYATEDGGAVSVLVNGPSSCRLADRRPVRVGLGGRRRQRGLRRRGVWARIRCDEPCRVRARGRLSLLRGGHRVRTRELLRSLPAHRAVTLKLQLSRRGLSALKDALDKGRRVRVRVSVRCRDAAGNLTRKSLLYRLVR
jgi:glucose/arabinose dehydrogenase